MSTAEYVDGVLSGDRTLLARAITLIESNAPAHQATAQAVLTALLPRRGASIRVGITGVPGAGKSTFIEALGGQLTAAGHRVAVLAVDPSSSLTGGSILGDKTRMEKLAADPGAFIRPSPSGGALGGVARKTRESIVLFEAAGYDVILVETVGVGQSEIQVRSMVDMFLLVLLAGAGDELQGIKKGVVEIADAILVNKADGKGREAAERARAEFEQVLHYLRPATPGWRPVARALSALSGDGVAGVWELVEEFAATLRQGGGFAARRAEQETLWMRALVAEGLSTRFERHPEVAARRAALEARVAAGEIPATVAALELLDLFGGGA
ncbi:methylmalonyl Co-A mutase-associated GTPase MeaB [bacterium]|nr:methylmalonyl Co-A mutase-associated GTPase MeaB [bacterium]